MGLDISHDTWNGAYSAFMRWRREICNAAGLPPLELMEGYWQNDQPVTGNPFWRQYDEDKRLGYNHDTSIWNRMPIKWECLKPSPLHELLYHSDCDGTIAWQNCKAIAGELKKVLKHLPNINAGGHVGNLHDTTNKFIKGLMRAYKSREDLVFS